MKALTIKSPWAFLIACGVKNIENRTWKTNFRGRIFIHQSKNGIEVKDRGFPFSSEQLKVLVSLIGKPPREYNNFNDIEWLKFFVNGGKKNRNSAIIGSVDIVDCVIGSPKNGVWAEYTEYDDEKPIYNWILANPKLYKNPIMDIKGSLSLWELNMEEPE